MNANINSVIDAFNAMELPCMYEGVRLDVMIKSKVFGDAFHSIFDSLFFSHNGHHVTAELKSW